MLLFKFKVGKLLYEYLSLRLLFTIMWCTLKETNSLSVVAITTLIVKVLHPIISKIIYNKCKTICLT